MGSFKRSLARDFKINVQTMDTVLNEEEGEEEEEEEEGEGEVDGRESGEDGEEAEEARPPFAKRQRKN